MTLSYTNFEERTMAQRFGVAQGSFEILRKILNGRKMLGLEAKVRIWHMENCCSPCGPALSYGVIFVGVTKACLEKFHGLCTRQLRALAN